MWPPMACPDDFASVQVDDRGQVEPALEGGQAGDVPDHPLSRRRGGEVAADQIGHRSHRAGRRPGHNPAFAASDPGQAMFTHQPLHPFVVHGVAAAAQFGGDPRDTVGTAVLGMNRGDQPDQLSLGFRSRGPGLLGGDPFVEALPAQAQDLAQPLHTELGAVFGDEPVAVAHRSISRAK